MSPTPRPPRRKGYALAAALAAAGLIGSGAWASFAILDELAAPAGFVRTAAAGGDVTLSRGVHVLYAEGAAPAALGAVGVTGPDGSVVPVRAIGEVVYDVPRTAGRDGAGGAVGTALGQFEAPVAGTFHLAAETDRDGAHLAVGHDVARAVLVAAALPAGTALAALVLALAVAVRTAQRPSAQPASARAAR